MTKPVVIAGAGLAGTLLALELERLGHQFEMWDEGSGATCSRVAAGIFNPLLGPRMTPVPGDWLALERFYRALEERLQTAFFHPLPIVRPWGTSKVTPAVFPRSGPGWSARAEGPMIRITGGGWLDLPALLDAARDRFRSAGLFQQKMLSPHDARGRRVVWCGGLADFTSEIWRDDPLVSERWQGVRGDVLTVSSATLPEDSLVIGQRFLLPLGNRRFRWGATHGIDDLSMLPRPEIRDQLAGELEAAFGAAFDVVGHVWGIRPASRTGRPLVGLHTAEPGWALFNGFAGKGVSAIPRELPAILSVFWP